MNAETLSEELIDSANQLMNRLERFTPATAGYKTGAEAWSATDVAEHLLILEKMANKVVRGETMETTRPPDQKMVLIETVMKDLSVKRTAPDGVCPSGKQGDLPAIIDEFRRQRALLGAMAGSADLSRACVALKHPGLGTLTVMEWLYFTSHHTRRHTAQLDSLLEQIPVREMSR